jgi:hypothetical protein
LARLTSSGSQPGHSHFQVPGGVVQGAPRGILYSRSGQTRRFVARRGGPVGTLLGLAGPGWGPPIAAFTLALVWQHVLVSDDYSTTRGQQPCLIPLCSIPRRP